MVWFFGAPGSMLRPELPPLLVRQLRSLVFDAIGSMQTPGGLERPLILRGQMGKGAVERC